MDSDRPSGFRRIGAVLLFLLLGTLVGTCRNRAVDSGRPDSVSSVVRGVAAPPANALGSVGRWFSEQTGWMFHGRTVASENRTLRTRVQQLEGELAAAQERGAGYDRLRQDLGFVKSPAVRLLAADVVARRIDPKFHTLILGRGAKDGVAPNDVVVTRNGVVGRVSEVTPTTATAVLLTDQTSGVGGMVQHPASRAKGVCKGDNSPFLQMLYLTSDASIRVGDPIVTSGLGGIFPKGLPIGKVVDVKTDPSVATKTARVSLAVDFDRLEEVYIRK